MDAFIFRALKTEDVSSFEQIFFSNQCIFLQFFMKLLSSWCMEITDLKRVVPLLTLVYGNQNESDHSYMWSTPKLDNTSAFRYMVLCRAIPNLLIIDLKFSGSFSDVNSDSPVQNRVSKCSIFSSLWSIIYRPGK